MSIIHWTDERSEQLATQVHRTRRVGCVENVVLRLHFLVYRVVNFGKTTRSTEFVSKSCDTRGVKPARTCKKTEDLGCQQKLSVYDVIRAVQYYVKPNRLHRLLQAIKKIRHSIVVANDLNSTAFLTIIAR